MYNNTLKCNNIVYKKLEILFNSVNKQNKN